MLVYYLSVSIRQNPSAKQQKEAHSFPTAKLLHFIGIAKYKIYVSQHILERFGIHILWVGYLIEIIRVFIV